MNEPDTILENTQSKFRIRILERMMGEAEVTEQVDPEMLRTAEQRARYRANSARWDLDIALFAFAVLITVIILLFVEIAIEIVAIAAAAGLALVWVAGWGRGEKLYGRFYDEELTKLRQESQTTVKETVEEIVDEKVRKALRKRQR
ncbi:MAG: hypothetical protein KKD83_02220 [Chloroflexi bacterium]|nr:hypothetical protein [Chloroflexota bacterium]